MDEPEKPKSIADIRKRLAASKEPQIDFDKVMQECDKITARDDSVVELNPGECLIEIPGQGKFVVMESGLKVFADHGIDYRWIRSYDPDTDSKPVEVPQGNEDPRPDAVIPGAHHLGRGIIVFGGIGEPPTAEEMEAMAEQFVGVHVPEDSDDDDDDDDDDEDDDLPEADAVQGMSFLTLGQKMGISGDAMREVVARATGIPVEKLLGAEAPRHDVSQDLVKLMEQISQIEHLGRTKGIGSVTIRRMEDKGKVWYRMKVQSAQLVGRSAYSLFGGSQTYYGPLELTADFPDWHLAVGLVEKHPLWRVKLRSEVEYVYASWN